MTDVKDRMELLFLYETKDCNPNGDPLEENRPRTDPDTGVALVTDVRIKRTIRDYLFYVKEKDILIRDTYDEKGFLRDGKGRAQSLEEVANITEKDALPQAVEKAQDAILKNFIDARLFGSTLPITPPSERKKQKDKQKQSAITITGPVQFCGFSRSLHKVNPMFIQGTAAFASDPGVSLQKTLREDFILPYALIATYGVVNEVSANTTWLTEEDVDLMLEGLWQGTASLTSRSKIGHTPLFLMRIRYKGQKQIGNLAGKLKLHTSLEDTKIRDVSEYTIDISTLHEALNKNKDNIKEINVYENGIKFTLNGKTGTFTELIEMDIKISKLW
jgi:CRISPR-associated protein Csh2